MPEPESHKVPSLVCWAPSTSTPPRYSSYLNLEYSTRCNFTPRGQGPHLTSVGQWEVARDDPRGLVDFPLRASSAAQETSQRR
jgi:hypothetical protein